MTGRRLIEKTPLTYLCDVTKLKPIVNEIKTRKLKLYRSTLPVLATLEGKRTRGRPKRRCRDDIKNWTNCSWSELNVKIRCRDEWRSLACTG